MGQEVEAQGQQGVDADDGDHPLPVRIGNDQRQEQKAHDQDQAGQDQVAYFLAAGNGVDTAGPDFDPPVQPFFADVGVGHG